MQASNEDPLTVLGRSQGAQLDLHDYRLLADFRYLIRRFLEFSQAAAGRAGLTPRQHQALLAIKGFAAEEGPTVGELAERLYIRHHSAVELVDRLVAAGLCIRAQDETDRRRVMLRLTAAADDRLAGLAAIHLAELRAVRPALSQILDRLGSSPR